MFNLDFSWIRGDDVQADLSACFASNMKNFGHDVVVRCLMMVMDLEVFWIHMSVNMSIWKFLRTKHINRGRGIWVRAPQGTSV